MKYLIFGLLNIFSLLGFSQKKDIRYLAIPFNSNISNFNINYDLHHYDYNKNDSIISIIISEKKYNISLKLIVSMSKQYSNITTDKIDSSSILSVENFSDSLYKYYRPFLSKYNFKIIFEKSNHYFIHDAKIDGYIFKEL